MLLVTIIAKDLGKVGEKSIKIGLEGSYYCIVGRQQAGENRA